MPSKDTERLIDRRINDSDFRALVRRDPEAALRDSGVALNEDERAALQAIDWSASDDQLVERINKAGF